MTDLIGVHVPFCNIRCVRDNHWFGPAEHSHVHVQAVYCAVCAERELHAHD